MKPKENTILKINAIFEKIYATNSFIDSENLEILKDLQDHINSMNFHKAKVAYFSNVKLKLNLVLELLNSNGEVKFAVKELKKFL